MTITDRTRRLAWATARAAAVALALGLAASAHGDDGSPRRVAPSLPAYTQECGSCHLAYPPGLLPARSWQRLMGGLESHFGSDASIDPATLARLSAWLEAHAGTARRAPAEPPPDDRITRSAWFVREHRRVDAATWRLPSVGSRANCAACHAGAERGRFDDDDLRLPAGLDAAQRRAWRH